MSAEAFIDTNVFIYHLDAGDRRKQGIAERIVRNGLATGNACISFQVVQECLNTVLRKAQIALDIKAARAYLDTVLAPLLQVAPSAALYHRALDVQAFQHLQRGCLRGEPGLVEELRKDDAESLLPQRVGRYQ